MRMWIVIRIHMWMWVCVYVDVDEGGNAYADVEVIADCDVNMIGDKKEGGGGKRIR